ncbi:hypothetical protein AX15_006672 [Amanita polypyramis BW_CC]|nr:hypothetical protein AX15_006672 [Amanita polypyramis BW_CC]
MTQHRQHDNVKSTPGHLSRQSEGSTTNSFPRVIPRHKLESTISVTQPGPTPSSSKSLPRTSTTASPYDWHEGASSIDVDATEDQLLPTSFITSLLREDKGPWTGPRASFCSAAVSGISEMTYPPINIPTTSRKAAHLSDPEQKPQGARPRPPSYRCNIEESSGASKEGVKSWMTFGSDTRTFVAQGTGHSEKRISSTTPIVPLRLPQSPEWKAGRTGDPTYKHQQPVENSAPSILSRISSRKSIRRIFERTKIKPLPPVPLIPDIPVAMEREHRKAEEARPLPELLQRAGTLRGLLERGYHPHHSLDSYHEVPEVKDLTSSIEDNVAQHVPRSSSNAHQHLTENRGVECFMWRMVKSTRSMSRSEAVKHWLINLFPLLFLIVVIIAIVVGVTVSKMSHHTGADCRGNFTGAGCDLDATCVCTSSTLGQCNGLARSIVDLIPNLEDQFKLNLTVKDVYIGLWQAQGSPPSRSKCTDQALLIDVAPALDSRSSPNRTQWARTAILWNLVESQDLEASRTLKSFVLEAPWNELLKNKITGQTTFITNVSGYTFDFASQIVLPPAQSYSAIGQPSAEQDSRVNSISRSALDYMYGYAVASSTQHSNSLMNYWRTALNRQPDELQTFRLAFSMSPILLPFDADTGSISNLLSTTGVSNLFPPLACYPALNETSLDKLNGVENAIFNMSVVTSETQFTADCFPNHPVYGVLDVLRLRLPFSDSRSGLPKQAALLQPAVSTRAVIYNGVLLSALAISTEGVPLTQVQQNPMQFGTLNHFDHVINNYFLAMPNTTVVNALIDFVLSSTHVPPAENSTLSLSLDTIPVIEVAVFGSIQSPDIQSVSSSFSTPSGSLFFGSTYGSILRQWSITGINSTLNWAQSATSPQTVRERNLTDKIFNEIWDAASQFQNLPTVLDNITASLTAYGYFAP